MTWNSIIAGYVKNGRAEDGLRLFRTMLETGVKPNALSLTSVLLGCSNLSALQLGKQVHQLVCKCPLSSDTTAGTLLFSMYSKCGDPTNTQKCSINGRMGLKRHTFDQIYTSDNFPDCPRRSTMKA